MMDLDDGFVEIETWGFGYTVIRVRARVSPIGHLAM
jgi:hypothetical protein